jgi:hypothetical protein
MSAPILLLFRRVSTLFLTLRFNRTKLVLYKFRLNRLNKTLVVDPSQNLNLDQVVGVELIKPQVAHGTELLLVGKVALPSALIDRGTRGWFCSSSDL